ncbi:MULTISPECIES: bifunctional isocitrate dehydrogenase kinase/phosphatase [Caldimonas]|uniref:bifunctional isocitrate dehydrogenase kinase/phosphatase n=1 Tax=Caldimonas TaxID=196013 RepID=UPI000379A335|nr:MULTISPECIES: bifunctional isocitrate dehydrogenase kinase/phosphatase [Caldimonas]MCX7660692.1 bifunctional isocitrate dehydrogenase kinase/phosphatase [Caldimonas manganoxidans]GIX23021.1 MAG: isocitrate dehydrogenase kinase/phosphatase [Caldimonas sp.]
MFPQKLTDPRAFHIAAALLEGFNRHYRLFRQTSIEAKRRFELADWHGQQRAQRERIEFYDKRVAEAVERLQREFSAHELPMDVWHQVKLHYIGLLTNHLQPELAETFFNSVTTKILHRSYFHNDFIFVRPAISTEYLENDEPGSQPTYRAYYPTRETLRETLLRVVTNFQLAVEFEDLGRDVDFVLQAMRREFGDVRLRTNFQLQVLSSLFFRNKGAYIVGKIVNGFREIPFALPILHTSRRQLVIDAALFGEDDLQMLFSFARAYFMVDMEIPAAYVQFLRSLMPRKPRSEIYNALGLHKQGKNLFYRDFLYHLRHSSDRFRIAPGIKGMVMLVFDLPSFPYVFKVIKDFYPPQKDTSRELIQRKYLLVKTHDRVGRMADTLEYSNVAFPRSRFEDELVAELKHFCGSQIEEDGDDLVIRHLYIERRMIPLNIYLQEASPAQIEHAVIEYGNAIKDLVAANIFPGDMLWKNFGVTRHGKVVFYDYDEIEYLTDCNFRKVPQPRTEEEELSGEVWYSVGPKDVFPETFGPFLLSNPTVREVFMRHHAELLDPAYWQAHKERILAGHVHDVFPYEAHKRFVRLRQAQPPSSPQAAGHPAAVS